MWSHHGFASLGVYTGAPTTFLSELAEQKEVTVGENDIRLNLCKVPEKLRYWQPDKLLQRES